MSGVPPPLRCVILGLIQLCNWLQFGLQIILRISYKYEQQVFRGLNIKMSNFAFGQRVRAVGQYGVKIKTNSAQPGLGLGLA